MGGTALLRLYRLPLQASGAGVSPCWHTPPLFEADQQKEEGWQRECSHTPLGVPQRWSGRRCSREVDAGAGSVYLRLCAWLLVFVLDCDKKRTLGAEFENLNLGALIVAA
jgi:hypothetical protein